MPVAFRLLPATLLRQIQFLASLREGIRMHCGHRRPSWPDIDKDRLTIDEFADLGALDQKADINPDGIESNSKISAGEASGGLNYFCVGKLPIVIRHAKGSGKRRCADLAETSAPGALSFRVQHGNRTGPKPVGLTLLMQLVIVRNERCD